MTARNASTPGPKPLLGDQPIDRLYRAALECVDRRGFRKTTMDDIARQAGVSRPTVYTYLPSKQHVVLEILVRQAAELLAGVRSTLGDSQGLDRIVLAAHHSILASRANPYYRSIIAGDQGAAWSAEVLRHERFREVELEFWRPTVQQAVDVGEARTDRPVDDLVDWIVFQQFAIATHADALNLDNARIHDLLDTYLRNALHP